MANNHGDMNSTRLKMYKKGLGKRTLGIVLMAAGFYLSLSNYLFIGIATAGIGVWIFATTPL